MQIFLKTEVLPPNTNKNIKSLKSYPKKKKKSHQKYTAYFSASKVCPLQELVRYLGLRD